MSFWTPFGFAAWLRRLQDAVRRPGKRRRRTPAKAKDSRPPNFRPEPVLLEDRSSFNDISLSAVFGLAAGAGVGAALFRDALMRVFQPPALPEVEHRLVDPNRIDESVHAREQLLPPTAPAAELGYSFSQASWALAAPDEIRPADAGLPLDAVDQFYETVGSTLSNPASEQPLSTTGIASGSDAGLSHAGSVAAPGLGAGSLAELPQPPPLADPNHSGLSPDAFLAPTQPSAAGPAAAQHPIATVADLEAWRAEGIGGPITGPIYSLTDLQAWVDSGAKRPPLPAGTGGTIEAASTAAPVASNTTAAPAATASVSFQPNHGQVDPQYQYFGHGANFDFYLSTGGISFRTNTSAPSGSLLNTADTVQMQFVGANATPTFVAFDPVANASGTPALTSPVKVTTTALVLAYGRVELQNVYQGIDLNLYANAQGKLEYDWVVGAGADVRQIQVAFQGANQLSLDAQGNLQIGTATGALTMHAPTLYQRAGSTTTPVTGNYVLDGAQVHFAVGAYDHSLPLIIDPVVDTLTASGTFRPAVVQAAGNTPNSVVTADFGNRGTDDIVIANFNGANLTLARSNGDGTFQSGTSIATGNGPNGLVVGDLTGFGQYDLVVSNYYDNTVGVLLSNGNDTFQPMVTYATGAGPANTALGDFNADGRLDIATANYNDGTLSVLLGNGNGTFASAVSYTAASGTIGIVARDLDGDDKVDLAASNYNSNTVSVLLGNGDGTFQSAVSYGVGPNPFFLAVGDFRGDGHPDLLTANFGSNTLSRLVNHGDGTFAAATSVTVGSNPTSLAVGNLNGRPDVVVGNLGSNDVSLLLTNADGSFQAEQRFAAGSNSGPNGVALGDFTGDGRLSVAVADQNSNSFTVLRNDTASATEGDSFTGIVARFTDSNPSAVASDFTATIDWGDGQTSSGTIQVDPDGGFDVVGTHTYALLGAYSLSVAIQSTGGGTATVANLANVSDAPVTATGASTLSVTEGTALTDVTVATFQDGTAELQPVVIGDTGFETPNVGTGTFGAFQYAPSGTAWSYSSGAGVAGNGSGFTSGNPNAPAGTQVGFLQDTGTFSQSVLFSAGTYVLSFQAAQRGNHQDSSQTFEVHIDGTTVGTFTPASTSYALETTDAFTVTAGAHTVAFVGLNPNAGDNTAFIDQLSVQQVSGVSVGDPGFETPSVGTGSYGAFQYNPSGSAWTFNSGSGLAGNGSGFTSGNPNAPEGTQVAFLQDAGSSVSQALTFAAGSYTLSFQAAQRGNYQPAGPQTIQVLIDGNAIGSFTPVGTDYSLLTTNAFTVAAGSHTVAFVGRTSGDSTAFLDAVSVNLPPQASPYEATIAWADGTAPTTGTITYDPQTGVFTVTGSHTYADEGDYNARVTITHDGRTAVAVTTVQVAEAAITPIGLFQPVVHYGAGNTPDGVATGDLDGDDNADVVVANFFGNSLSVFLGNGDGALGSPTTYATGAGPNGIVIADFDGDTVADLVVGNFYESTATVYLGNGDGTFTLGGTYATGSNPANRTALGDFDGDTFLDVAFADQGDSSISILFGNGDGTFQAPVTYATGRSGTDAIVAGDFDGDGAPDLAAANFGDSTVSVFLNDGTGAFASPVTYSVGANPFDIDVVPLGPSGNLAIATANFYGNSVSVLAGNGDGTFGSAVNYGVGANPTSLAVGTINGRPDLLVGAFGSSQVSLLLANANGTFQAVQNYATGSGPNGIAVADFNNDGKPDVVTADQNANTASVLLNASIAATGGELFSGRVASFADANALAQPDDFLASIDWGDSTASPGQVVANGTGGFDVLGTHFYSREGDYAVTASVIGSSFSISNLANVADAALLAAGTNVTAFSGMATGPTEVARFRDLDLTGTATDFGAFIDWGDGNTSPGTVSANGDGSFSVLGDHTYTGTGPRTVQVAIEDEGGSSANTTSTAFVGDSSGTDGTIQGSVFNDLNGSRLWETGKPTLAGRTIELLNSLNQVIASTQTASNGSYSFTNLAPGTYSVRQMQPTGWTSTAGPGSPTSVQGGGTYSTDFGTFQNTSISGTKFEDVNRNGTYDDCDKPLPGWTIQVSTMTGNQTSTTPVQTLITSSSGYYRAGDLPPLLPGTYYVVHEVQQPGWQQTYPQTSTTNTVIVGTNERTFVIQPLSGVPMTVPGGPTTVVTGPGSVTINTFNNNTPANVSFNDNAGHSGTANTLLTQFNVTYQGSTGTPVTFNTFCFDLFHTVTQGETYQVTPQGNLTPVFTNGNRISYIFKNYGLEDLSSNPIQAAAVQLAIWDLSLSNHNPTYFTQDVGGTYSSGDPGVFSVDLGGNPNAAAIASLTDLLLRTSIGATNDSGWFDSSVQLSNPGQNLLVPEADPSFGNTQRYPKQNFDPYQGETQDIGDGWTEVFRQNGNLHTEVGTIDPTRSPNQSADGGGTNVGFNPVMGSVPGSGQSVLTRSTNLKYNSSTVNPRPIVSVTVPTRITDPVPGSIRLTVTFNGTTLPTQTYSVPSGQQPGQSYTVSMDVPPVSSTGLYHWQADYTVLAPDSTVLDECTSYGTSLVVNRSQSEDGPGWSSESADELDEVDDGHGNRGVVWVDGKTSSARYFRANPDNSYQSPANDFGTLVKNGNSSFTYTAKDQTRYTFGAGSGGAHRLTQIQDPHNLTRTFTYDSAGKLTSIESPDGGVETLTYDTVTNLLKTVQTPSGTVRIAERDAAGNPTRIVMQDGSLRSMKYATSPGNSQPLLINDPWGPFNVTFTYDALGRLSTVDRGLGTVQTYKSQDEQGLGTTAQPADQTVATMTEAVSPTVNRTTTYVLDDAGRLIKQIAPDATVQTWDRDFAGNVTRYTDELGRATTYTFDYGAGKGDLVQATRPDGTTMAFKYDPTFHNITEVRDPLGRFTTYTYDPATGDLLTERDALGQVGTFTYYQTSGVSNGLVHTLTDRRGYTMTFTYDAARRPATVVDPLGHQTSYDYDAAGNVSRVTDALGRVTTATFDALRRQVSTTDPLGQTAHYTYDAVDDLTSMTDELGRTTAYVYDQRGWLISITEAVGTPQQRTTTIAYFFNGPVQSTTDPLGRVNEYGFDLRDRLVTTIEAANTPEHRTLTTTYDAVSNVTSESDGLGRVTAYTYDVMDRVTQATEALGTSVQRTTTFGYDAVGNVVQQVNPRGEDTRYTFDALDRMVSLTEAYGTPIQRTGTFAYDPNSNLVSETDVLGRVTAYVYDPDNRLVVITRAAGTLDQSTTTFAYDAVDNLTQVTDPLGHLTSISYDALDRQTDVTEALGTADERTTHYSYDAVANVIGVTDALGRVTDFSFDALDRMVSTTQAVGSPVQRTLTYAYDAVDNVVGLTDGLGRDQVMSYDGLDRLASTTEAAGTPLARTAFVSYDAADNPVTTTDALGRVTHIAYDDLDRMTSMTEAVGTSVERTTTFAYDAADNLVTREDALGRVTLFVYDLLDRPVSVTEAAGTSEERTTTQEFDGADNMTRVTDALGRTTHYVYDNLDRMVSETDAEGTALERTTTWTYDVNGNLLQATDPRGNVRTYAYDALDRLVTVTEAASTADQRTFQLGYDAEDNNTSFVDALGRTTLYTYDELDRRSSVTEAAGTLVERTSTYAYDDADNQTEMIDPLGHVTQYAYDDLDRMTAMTEAVGTPVERTTTYGYDAVDNRVSFTDGLGRITLFAYDDLDRMTSMTEAAGTSLARTTTYAYDAVDNRTATTDALGRSTVYAYDALDRMTVVTLAAGTPVALTTTFAFDAMDNLAQVTDALGRITLYTYDDLDRKTALTEAAGTSVERTVAYAYDANDNLTAITDAAGALWTYAYDALDRQVSIATPVGGLWQTAFDAMDNISATTDGLGHATTYAYDALNRRISMTDPCGRETLLEYDLVNNLTALTDPGGNRTDYAYDALDRQVQRTDALGFSSTRSFDAADELTVLVDRDGRQRILSYDALGRLTTETWLAFGGGVDNVLTYTYDAVNSLLAAADSHGTYTYGYDERNRLVQQTDLFGLTLTFSYDILGNRTQTADSLGGVETSSYDELNRLTSRQLSSSGTAPVRVDFTYTARDQIETIHRYADLAGTLLVGTSSYTYDAGTRIATLQHRDGSGTLIADYSYSFDAADRLTSQTVNGLTTTYAYSDCGELIQEGVRVYTYDANGNRTDGGGVIGPDNRLLSDGTWNYFYDAEGNLTSKVNHGSGDHWDFTYDERNQMTSAVQRDSGGGLLQSATHQRDVFGNRVQTVTVGGSTPGTQQMAYADSANPWADLTGGGAVDTRRTWGDGVDQPLARTSPGGGGDGYYLPDQLGSIRDTTDSSGAPAAHTDYDAFGNPTNPNAGDRYKYTGQEYDPATGNYDYNSRQYDPAAGRYNNQDPIFPKPDSNPYRYVHNQPTNNTDPSGQDLWAVNASNGKPDGASAQRLYQQFVHEASKLPPGESQKIDPVQYNLGDGKVELSEDTKATIQKVLELRGHELDPGLRDVLEAAVGTDKLRHVASGPKGTLLAAKVMRGLGPIQFDADAPEGWAASIPIYSSLRNGANAAARGKPLEWAWHSVNAIADVFLVKSLATGALKQIPRLFRKPGPATRLLLRDAGRFLKEQVVGPIRDGVNLVRRLPAAVQQLKKPVQALGNLYKRVRNGRVSDFCPGACFAAGTRLLTPNGTRSIEDFRVGDLVLSRNEFDVRGSVEARTVEEVFVRVAPLMHVHVAGQVIRTTAEHPFFVEGSGWLPAGALQVGDRLATVDGWAAVEDLCDAAEVTTVYNLRVADYHTYFVGMHAAAAIWAHNAGAGYTPDNYAPRTNQVPYGFDFSLSKKAKSLQALVNRALEYRVRNNIMSGKNLLVVQYLRNSGKVAYKVFVSEGKGRHSEVLFADWLKRRKLPLDRIKRIYTERSPCLREKCHQLLDALGIPPTRVFYSFEQNVSSLVRKTNTLGILNEKRVVYRTFNALKRFWSR